MNRKERGIRKTLAAILLAGAAMTFAPTVGAQGPAPGAQSAPRPMAGPLAPDQPIAKGYNDSAKALAAVDNNPLIQWEYRIWCEYGYRTRGEIGAGQTMEPLPNPTTDLASPKGFLYTEHSKLMPAGGVKFADNAWYFGTDLTGAIVVKQADGGLLMFDALTTPQDMQSQMIDQMKVAGLNPADFKYIFMGHQHGDHVGGANLIREKYAPGVKFVMGAPDAQGIATARAAVMNGTAPNRGPQSAKPLTAKELEAQKVARLAALPDKVDVQVAAYPGIPMGAQRINTGGNTEVVAVMAPGHTVGQMHVIVPVMLNGQPHKLLVMSGNDNIRVAGGQYASSVDFLRSVANLEGADAWINTHGYQGAAFYHLRQLKTNSSAPNPFFMGTDGVQRYLGIFAECQRAMGKRFADGTWKSL